MNVEIGYLVAKLPKVIAEADCSVFPVCKGVFSVDSQFPQGVVGCEGKKQPQYHFFMLDRQKTIDCRDDALREDQSMK